MGMGIPMGIPVGMGWVWGLKCHPTAALIYRHLSTSRKGGIITRSFSSFQNPSDE